MHGYWLNPISYSLGIWALKYWDKVLIPYSMKFDLHLFTLILEVKVCFRHNFSVCSKKSLSVNPEFFWTRKNIAGEKNYHGPGQVQKDAMRILLCRILHQVGENGRQPDLNFYSLDQYLKFRRFKGYWQIHCKCQPWFIYFFLFEIGTPMQWSGERLVPTLKKEKEIVQTVDKR